MKFEAVRQEIDGTIARQMRWVLWENKETSKEVLNRIGSFAGLCYECINRGSVRQGLPILDGEHEQHEENDWALVGTRIRSVSMTGSLEVVAPAGHPGALGKAFPLAAYQSAGGGESDPQFWPPSNWENAGF